MKIQDILAKIAKGEGLTDEEKKYAGDYKADGGDENRIPKARLDAEIAKRNAAETSVSELQNKLQELQDKLDEMQNAGMSEAEKAKAETAKQIAAFQKQVSALTKERDDAQKKAADMEFGNAVRKLADSSGFTDPEYLGYKLRAAGVKVEDEAAVAGLVKELETSSPALFRSNVKSGAGTGGGTSGAGVVADAKARLEEYGKKAELSARDVAEVIKLQAEASKDSSGKQ